MPPLNFDDTIAALSTPSGEGGTAVIRVSGKQAVSLVSQFFRSSKNQSLEEQPTHTIRHGYWVDGGGEKIDEVLVSVFRAPHSYTGEEVVEVSLHGGVRLTRKILELLFRAGARAAEPGEFTRRAFLHGKIDLTQAEAVLDLIRSRSDASLAASFRQLEGGLSRKINQLKEGLLKIYAHLEARIDFPDERLDVASHEESLRRMEEAAQGMEGLVASFQRGARLREGVLTVILGRPNVGKSSLLNTLLARDYALVSEIPGTTRDALEAEIELGGMGLRLVDTAGLGDGGRDPLNRMAMERTRRYLSEGDLFIFLVDGSSAWSAADEEIVREINGKPFLPVVNKIDLPQKLDAKQLESHSRGETPCFISCASGSGILELEKKIRAKMEGMEVLQESLTLTRLRHKQAIEKSLEALGRSREGMEKEISPELILEDLKVSLDALRELIGEIYSEDLLDVVFREFCIGK